MAFPQVPHKHIQMECLRSSVTRSMDGKIQAGKQTNSSFLSPSQNVLICWICYFNSNQTRATLSTFKQSRFWRMLEYQKLLHSHSSASLWWARVSCGTFGWMFTFFNSFPSPNGPFPAKTEHIQNLLIIIISGRLNNCSSLCFSVRFLDVWTWASCCKLQSYSFAQAQTQTVAARMFLINLINSLGNWATVPGTGSMVCLTRMLWT